MLDKIKELINRPKIYKITMIYETYGKVLITCIIKRPYIKHLAIQSSGTTEEKALNNTLKLLKKVEEIEKQNGNIKMPDLEKQTYINGYYRESLGNDVLVEFKRTESGYNITNILSESEFNSKKSSEICCMEQ